MLSVSVMLHQIFVNDTSKVFNSNIGKTIQSLSLGDDEALHFIFDDGAKMKIFDDGQSCCEERFMRTDDDLSEYVGAKLLGAEVRDVTSNEDGYGTHEIQFFVINTDKGMFTMSSHNEHNGYYGGFALVATDE